MFRQRRVASHQILLNHDAAADGFDGTIEDRNEPVAGGFNQPAVMFYDAGFDEIALDALDTVVRLLRRFASGGCNRRYRLPRWPQGGAALVRAVARQIGLT